MLSYGVPWLEDALFDILEHLCTEYHRVLPDFVPQILGDLEAIRRTGFARMAGYEASTGLDFSCQAVGGVKATSYVNETTILKEAYEKVCESLK